MSTKLIESIRERVRDANRTEDRKELLRLLAILRFRLDANFLESARIFAECDPSIDIPRFDELCQIADAAV